MPGERETRCGDTLTAETDSDSTVSTPSPPGPEPDEFRTVNPSFGCLLSNNPGFSCANVGAGTSCCTGDGLFSNNCGEGLSGGPCYAG